MALAKSRAHKMEMKTGKKVATGPANFLREGTKRGVSSSPTNYLQDKKKKGGGGY
jgi:hypothetical protein